MMNENDIGTIIVDTAISVHKAIGPGLSESVYKTILYHELKKRGLSVEEQVKVPIEYHGLKFDEGFTIDIFVENKVIIELKCVESVSNFDKKRVLTYLRLTNCKLGYLLNFGESLMKDGIVRVINGTIR